MKLLFLLLATVTTVLAATSSTEEIDDGPPNDKGKLFFKAVSTQSHTLVSFTTSTVFFSCFNGLSTDGAATPIATPCPGKRRKRRRSIINLKELNMNE